MTSRAWVPTEPVDPRRRTERVAVLSCDAGRGEFAEESITVHCSGSDLMDRMAVLR
jgi:hypothetical protein